MVTSHGGYFTSLWLFLVMATSRCGYFMRGLLLAMAASCYSYSLAVESAHEAEDKNRGIDQIQGNSTIVWTCGENQI